jgi:hypothetical protein
LDSSLAPIKDALSLPGAPVWPPPARPPETTRGKGRLADRPIRLPGIWSLASLV